MNPTEMLSIFDNHVRRNDTHGNNVVELTGIYLKTGRQSYNGIYYDYITDDTRTDKLSLLMPDRYREQIEHNSKVTLQGVVQYKKDSSNGSVQMQFRVTQPPVVEQQQAIDPDDERRLQLVRSKQRKNVEFQLQQKIFANERPSIVLIFAESSITDQDFQAGLKAAQTCIDFREERINFRTTAALANLLIQADEDHHDAVCIIRGGGQGQEVLNALPLLEAVAQMHTPVVTGVGHIGEEHLWLKELADYDAGTPSLLGTWLKDVAESVEKQRSHSLAAARQQYETQIKNQTAQIQTLQKQLAPLNELNAKLNQLTRSTTQQENLINNLNNRLKYLQKKNSRRAVWIVLLAILLFIAVSICLSVY